MKKSGIVGAFACLLMLTGCDGSDSSVKQLKSQLSSFKCEFNASRVAMVKEKYGKYISSSVNDAWRKKIINYTSLTPDAYLEYMFVTNDVHVSYRSSGGLTTLGGPGPGDRDEGPERPGRPYKITISSGQPQYNGMLHEIGHAVEPYIDDLHPTTFHVGSKYWYQTAAKSGNSESSEMWSYPKTNRFEYWAELFDSYYCSDESRVHMEETYPRSFQFAQRYLVDPKTPNAPADSTSAFKMKADPEGDEDNDGIINKLDQCSHTKPGAALSKDEKYVGCAGGQFTDNINKYLGR